MLIRITNHCNMACCHCMINATPKGEHMDMSRFVESVTLANKMRVRFVMISGGEPTDHPQYHEFLNYLKFNFQGIVAVASHGKYIDDPARCQEVFGQHPEINYQITNDERYYPHKLDRNLAQKLESQYSNVGFVWKIGGEIVPQGRARKHLKITEENARVKGPRCFNLRSANNNKGVGSIAEAIHFLESAGKLCTPSVNIDGSISMGESSECPPVAHVTDSIEAISNKIKESQCNECGMLNKLPSAYHEIIGYNGISFQNI